MLRVPGYGGDDETQMDAKEEAEVSIPADLDGQWDGHGRRSKFPIEIYHHDMQDHRVAEGLWVPWWSGLIQGLPPVGLSILLSRDGHREDSIEDQVLPRREPVEGVAWWSRLHSLPLLAPEAKRQRLGGHGQVEDRI